MCAKTSTLLAGLSILAQLANNVVAAPVDQILPLYETDEDGLGATIWFSHLNDTILGMDATELDYEVLSNKRASIDSILHLAGVHVTGDHESILVAVTNATLIGGVTDEQAANRTWLCNELGRERASHSPACDDIDVPAEPDWEYPEGDAALDKRSLWVWLRKTAHISSVAAMDILQSDLQDRATDYLKNSPRSLCDKLNGVRACLSWSKVESFQANYAAQMAGDALSDTDLGKYSVMAKGILGSKKRAGADVCFSDRPDGCT
ncbi:hypothetical protein LTR85_009145 [Meristemomyces frigidus]|nr:hypothetical protein LTR85_009145 [Meristemomyces frigidus]